MMGVEADGDAVVLEVGVQYPGGVAVAGSWRSAPISHSAAAGAVLTRFDRNQRYFNRDHPDQPMPTITLHGLRHTWATLALSAGIDIKIVSERLNHSSTHITREIYTHVTPPMQSNAAEQVARLFIQP